MGPDTDLTFGLRRRKCLVVLCNISRWSHPIWSAPRISIAMCWDWRTANVRRSIFRATGGVATVHLMGTRKPREGIVVRGTEKKYDDTDASTTSPSPRLM